MGLSACSAALLTLAFLPYGQFYLAWIALVPWLVLLNQQRSLEGTALWGGVAGLLFFAANVWWLWTATIAGMIAAIIYHALYWSAAALALRWCGLPAISRVSAGRATAMALIVPAVWISTEWMRQHVFGGFPWLFIGHSQSPAPLMCQVADLTGVAGVSYWVLMLNVLAAMWLVHRAQWRALLPATAMGGIILIAILGYGAFRLRQEATRHGPRVMVVQSNHPHLPGGAPTATREQIVDYHLHATRAAAAPGEVDLIVWSESVMPPLNVEARQELSRAPAGQFLQGTHESLSSLSADLRSALVTGGFYVGNWRDDAQARVGTEIRNAVYVYDSTGQQLASRYDKIMLVPFAEVVPLRDTVPWLAKLLSLFAADVTEQITVPGDVSAKTRFRLSGAEDSAGDDAPAAAVFVTPICLEMANGPFIAAMISTTGARKEVDFIVNLSNDGWFANLEKYQHLQAVLFRSIENRVPIARSSNTGISGFIDSCGRMQPEKLLRPNLDGALSETLMLDQRFTVYSRVGDLFAWLCAGASLLALVVSRFIRPKLTP